MKANSTLMRVVVIWFEESRGLAKPRTPKASDAWRDWKVVDDDGDGGGEVMMMLMEIDSTT